MALIFGNMTSITIVEQQLGDAVLGIGFQKGTGLLGHVHFENLLQLPGLGVLVLLVQSAVEGLCNQRRHLLAVLVVVHPQFFQQVLEPLEPDVEVVWVLPVRFFSHLVVDEQSVLPKTELLRLGSVLGHLLHLLQLLFTEGHDQVLVRNSNFIALFVFVLVQQFLVKLLQFCLLLLILEPVLVLVVLDVNQPVPCIPLLVNLFLLCFQGPLVQSLVFDPTKSGLRFQALRGCLASHCLQELDLVGYAACQRCVLLYDPVFNF